MGFIPDITCRHCGKKFSAIHGRCPHCGAKKVKQPGTLPPKTAADVAGQSAGTASSSGRTAKTGGVAASLFNANTRWQFLFGCILILLVIVAVIVLIATSVQGTKKPAETPPVNTVEVTTPPPTTAPPTLSPTPTVAVSSISIKTAYDGQTATSFTMRPEWGDLQLKAEVYPVEALTYAQVEWRSTDDAVVTVDDTGLLHVVGSGTAEIIAECGGVATSCKVYAP